MKKVALSFIIVFLALGIMANTFILAEGNGSTVNSNTSVKVNSDLNKTKAEASSETRKERKNEVEDDEDDIDDEEDIKEHRKNLTEEHKKRIFEERNRLKENADERQCPVNCKCSGSTIKCLINGTRELTIHAGESGNLIIQVKDISVSAPANVELYKENDILYAKLKNNETKIIRVLPDEVKEKIRAKIKAKLENESINLTEDGNYRIMAHKKARLFFLIPVNEEIGGDVDAETGVFVLVKKPWWGFMAKDEQGEVENNQVGETGNQSGESENNQSNSTTVEANTTVNASA